jgi:hypothetical protein
MGESLMKTVKKFFGCFLLALLLIALNIPGVTHTSEAHDSAVKGSMISLLTDDGTNPESTVIFSGNNNNNEGYIPGETVHVEVKGPDDKLLTCDAVVDATGAWSCSVNLWQNSRITGTFYYQANGLQSGVSFTGSFSNDSAIESVQLYSGDQEILEGSSVGIGSVIDASVLVNSTNMNFVWGSTKYQIQQQKCNSDGNCAWVSVFASDCINLPEPDL